MNARPHPHAAGYARYDRHFELDEADLITAVATYIKDNGRDIAPGVLALSMRDGAPCTGIRMEVIDAETPLFDAPVEADR